MNVRGGSISRRGVLLQGAAWGALIGASAIPARSFAQDAGPQPEPFSFDTLTETVRQRAKGADPVPPPLSDFLASIDYDRYRMIRFSPDKRRWAEDGSNFRISPFHIGGLFKEPVKIHEVVDDKATELQFTTADFEYRDALANQVPQNFVLPGVAGFMLVYPLNRPDVFDEVISFIGASYFRALGQDNAYGLSARGLAIDSGLSMAEEFPRFTGFWLQKPAPGGDSLVIYAALDSASLTGAYRFVLTPGVDTRVDVTARLFFRSAVTEIGVAPLTSMFLFADVNRGHFDDFRPQVHDSDGLRITRENGDILWRALNNPAALASSYFSETRPQRFGLHQRQRDFDHYQDAESHYERRPSVDIEPIGDWGSGRIKLVEIPSNLEVHDNIVAYWVPDQKFAAGDSLEISYRMNWGWLPVSAEEERAIVVATRSGVGGAAGIENPPDTRKFVVDFKGGMLSRLPADDKSVQPVVTISKGRVDVVTLHRIDGTDMWRLVVDIASDKGDVCELSAHVAGYGRKLSEIWMFQWVKP